MMNEKQILAGLATLEPTHPFIEALGCLLANVVEAERDGVVIPNLPDAARHFNAGRLASALDVQTLVAQTVAKAISQAAREA